MTERDPRQDPQPGDLLEHPTPGCFRQVRLVEMDRVYFIKIDQNGGTQRASETVLEWRQRTRGAHAVPTDDPTFRPSQETIAP